MGRLARFTRVGHANNGVKKLKGQACEGSSAYSARHLGLQGGQGKVRSEPALLLAVSLSSQNRQGRAAQ